MAENRLRFIKRVIYSLKRQYGGPVDVYQNVIGPTNYETGQRSVTKNKWSIRQAIRLPRDIMRDALFDQLGNRVFAYGNMVQLADRTIIIDWRDLPTMIGDDNWYVIIDGHHYEIVRAEAFDNNAALFVVLKELTGQALEQVVSIDVTDNIATTPTATTQ